MDTLINEGLMLISTVIVLPVIAGLTWAFFAGRLTRTENAKYLAVLEKDEDYWASPGAKAPARPVGGKHSNTIEGGVGA
jgi:hypothetical protein